MEPLTDSELDHIRTHRDFDESDVRLATRAIDEILRLRKETKRLDEKVREMQAHSTQRLGELRMWKARAKHTKELLTAVLVDFPLVYALSKDEAANVEAVLQRVQRVHDRNELLEKDVNCISVDIAREFIKQSKVELSAYSEGFEAFIRVWRAKFVHVLGE